MIRLDCLDCGGAGELWEDWVIDRAAYTCPSCRGSGYLLAPPDFAEVVAALIVFLFVFAGVALFAWWVLA